MSAYVSVCGLKAFLDDGQGHVAGVKTVLVKWSKDATGRWTFSELPGACNYVVAVLLVHYTSASNVLQSW